MAQRAADPAGTTGPAIPGLGPSSYSWRWAPLPYLVLLVGAALLGRGLGWRAAGPQFAMSGSRGTSMTGARWMHRPLVLTVPRRATADRLRATPEADNAVLVPPSAPLAPAIAEALEVLAAFDREFLRRAAHARAGGEPLAVAEFQRAQQLGAEGLRQERLRLRQACEVVAADSDAVTLGIMAPTGERAFQTLREWVTGLRLVRGEMVAVDGNGLQQPDPKAWWAVPVFVKYSSTGTTPGRATMAPYNGPNTGVIFTPMLPDGAFRQFGDLPLHTFAPALPTASQTAR